ncbi:hypothetical protein [Paenibacillus solani]|uniref:Tail tape measure protein n=1 Tax=Paenibacillus solani TaxID=1705565 RepID=A0A0M1NKA5_9BACL|nr:hypothetical protein [Paenibacillus solani]KOR82537.1 hypothetical protein AM231_19710 [Paenibacillus solani]
MAEAMNYRMNLVIDPKNVIKANRELRAMERYFERIQGRVLRIGRTRMAPEIVLKDSASKGLDNLLDKMQRIKSQVIQASANVRLDVQKQIDTNLNLSVQKQIETSVKVDMQAFGLDFSPLTQALQANTDALYQLTSTLGSLDFSGGGGEQTPKSGFDKVVDVFSAFKTFGGGVKSLGELPDKTRKVGDTWLGNPKTDTKKGNSNSDTMTETRTERGKRQRRGKSWRTIAAAGDLMETVGNAGAGILGGARDLWKSGSALFKGSDSGIVSSSKDVGGGATASMAKDLDSGNKAAHAAPSSSPVSNLSAAARKRGLGSGLMKSFGKRALGPLGYIADVTDIASAEPGKERNQAIGSAVGGSVGAAIGGFFGSVIPVAGTLVGSTIGGTIGSFAGEKLGGAITGIGEKFTETKEKMSKWFSNTFSFGKKDKEAAQQKDVPKSPPSSPTIAAIPDPIIRKPSSVQFSKPLLPDPALYGSYVPPSHSSSSGTFGPPASTARNQAMAENTSPQPVQISPEQMSMFSGYFKDFKTETTVNYNLPSGAVQVTVNEEHPVDVEGLILLIGQRLRAEMTKAAQNRKPSPMAY